LISQLHSGVDDLQKAVQLFNFTMNTR